MFPFKKYDFKNYNFSLLVFVVIACSFGAFLIQIVQKDTENLFQKQIIGIILGLIIAIIVSLIDYHFIAQFYIILYIINLVLLLYVKFFGKEINYSKRWIAIGSSFTFQPSELSKIIMVIVLAKLFNMLRHKMDKFYVLVLAAIIMAVPTLLILTQTDLSTSMVLMFLFAMMIFCAGLSYKIILPIIIIFVPLVMGLFWYIQQPYQIILQEYQQQRVLAMLHPELDEYSNDRYQQENSIQVIGSGKLTGKLLTEGKDAIISDTYVPISESDFIFAVAGEAFGFIGGCIIISLLGIIIFKALLIAHHAADYLGMLMAIGISSMFMFQVFVNIGVATSILPNTGLPLPFLSYGLSSLLSSMIAIGLLLNINLQRKRRGGNTI
jgi:rod shape determining protein RodA